MRHYSGEKAQRILEFVTTYGPCWVQDIASALEMHHNVVTFHGKRMSQLTHYHTTEQHPKLYFARKTS